ncbi:DUF4416 family protein [Candidatus Poribacteria bacterium]|nr:DUF4416 family protein [Candidatus Poribacteria bacterium]
MGEIRKTDEVKLVIPTLYSDEKKFKNIFNELINIYGEVDYISPLINFNYSDYYIKEMGSSISRVIYSFKKLINSDELANIKTRTNELESFGIIDSKRSVNLDPGYMELAKLILATTKNFSHRIYIGKGIFAECTLVFRKNTFISWEWTYPDYRTLEYIKIFNNIREIYKKQL